jgi:hypothetical protein
MANERLTDLDQLETLLGTGLIHVVDPTDNTQNVAGTSFKMTKDDFLKENTAAILLNTNKVSFDTTSSTRLSDTSGVNTGNQDLSGLSPINNPTFTGTVGGITKTMVGLSNADNTSDANKPLSLADASALLLKLNTGGYTGTAADLKTLIDTINTGTIGTTIVPTSTAPAGTGAASFFAVQNGTYTNYGGLVVAANSFAIISRSATGVFTISQTTLNLSSYATLLDLYSLTVSSKVTTNIKESQNSDLNIYAYNYNTFTSTQAITKSFDGSDVVLQASYFGITFINTGYVLDNTENRVVEMTFKPSAITGASFGFTYIRNGVKTGLVYRQSGAIYEVIEAGNAIATTQRNIDSLYAYLDNDIVSIKARIKDGIVFIQTSINGVYSPILTDGTPHAWGAFDYAFRSSGTIKSPRFKSKIEAVELLKTIYVNNAGLDTNTGLFPVTQSAGGGRILANGPLKTITKALTMGADNIIIFEGTYLNETNISLVKDINITPYKGGEVIIDLGARILGSTFTVNATYANVFQVNIATVITTLYEVDYTKFLYTETSIANVAARDGSCFHTGGVLYVNPFTATISSVSFIYPNINGFKTIENLIPGTSFYDRIARNININGVTTLYAKSNGFDLQFCNFKIVRCNAFGSFDNGFGITDGFGSFVGCEASYNDGDGFNVHGFNNQNECHVELDDCTGNNAWGVLAGNDGVSYHEKTKGIISNSTFLGNSKYDIVHVQTAEIQHFNINCGSFNMQMDDVANHTTKVMLTNVFASLEIGITANLGNIDLLMQGCFSPLIKLYGTGFINGNVLRNKTKFLDTRVFGTLNFNDNKIKAGTGIRIDKGVQFWDGNLILNNVSGFTKNGGTVTMGTNNLNGNTTNYNGSAPVDALEQAKNLSYLSV